MNRRDLLKYTALATGASIGVPLMSTFLAGCQTDIAQQGVDYELQFFADEEIAFVRAVIDQILPKTDSPSATEVGVDKMIDSMVGTVYEEKNKAEYKNGFAALTKYLDQETGGKAFQQLDAAQQLNALKQLENSTGENLAMARQAFLDLKQQTVAYYLSTEEIGTNYLNYLPVPGQYEPCIDLAEVGGKAWTL